MSTSSFRRGERRKPMEEITIVEHFKSVQGLTDYQIAKVQKLLDQFVEKPCA